MQRHLVIIVVTAVMIGSSAASAQTNPGDAIEKTSFGFVNWTSGVVYATGVGAAPAGAVNIAQARAMAERSAVVVAYRNLLDVVKGVSVDAETNVGNYTQKSEVVRLRVEGIVKEARIVSKQYLSDGSIEVQLSMPLKGALMDTVLPTSFGKTSAHMIPHKPSDIQQPSKPVLPSKPPVPGPKSEPVKPPHPTKTPIPEVNPEPPVLSPPASGATTVEFKGGVATGLVIDGRGLGLKPALLPRIVDAQGHEIYVGQVATRTNAVEQGVAGYAKDVNAAANNFRVTDNPAVIKGLRASGSARTDIVLAQADAEMLRQLGRKSDFLQNCRVIIVY